MKCPNCGNEMIESRAGNLCLSCGHLEPHKIAKTAQPASAPLRPPADKKSEPEPELEAESKTHNEPEAGSTPSAAVAADPPSPPLTTQVAPLDKPPLKPKTHPRRLGLMAKILLTGIGLVVVGCMSYVVFVHPRQALASYVGRLTSAKTSTFAVAHMRSGDAYGLNIKVDGKGDLTNASNPKQELSTSGLVSIGEVSGNVSIRLKMLDKTFYFKLGELGPLSGLLPIKISDNWYKFALPDAKSNKCFDNQNGWSTDSAIDLLRRLKLPVTQTSFAGVEMVNGAPSLHYRGRLDNAKAQAVLDAANKKLPAECQLSLPDGIFKDLTISYDLWQGWSADRLKLVIKNANSKSTDELIFDSSGYNRSVKIEAPAGAKDSSELLADLLSAYSEETQEQAKPTPDATPAPIPPTTGASDRDTQRKINLAAYAAAYKATAQNGFYAVNPPTVGVTATDPATGQAYVIGKSVSAALGQIQYKPGGRCSGVSVTPGASGTRYLALLTTLETTTTQYCLDVK